MEPKIIYQTACFVLEQLDGKYLLSLTSQPDLRLPLDGEEMVRELAVLIRAGIWPAGRIQYTMAGEEGLC